MSVVEWRAKIADLDLIWRDMLAEIDDLRAEIGRLQAENKELRAKLDKANEPLWPRTEL